VVVAGFFIYRTITLQSQLRQARDESVQLQAQVNEARAELGKAEANVRGLAEETAKLQPQLKQAQVDAATAKANAEKASAEVANMQAQLDQAKRGAAEARVNAEKASAEVARLQGQMQAQSQPESKPAQVESAPQKPAAANSSHMPLSATFRTALIGSGQQALVIQNTSNDTLSVNVKFTNPGSGANKEYRLALDGGAVKELGSLGAWILATGDKIEIESAGYDPIVMTAP
jgi:multidrug efflux pump subunit AcrA (membrane-fusion protein)